jgi:hypothetical protein
MPSPRELPTGRRAGGEGRHGPPEGIGDRPFGDTRWVNVVDPSTDDRGYGRIEANDLIDGGPQSHPPLLSLDPGRGARDRDRGERYRRGRVQHVPTVAPAVGGSRSPRTKESTTP